MSTFIKVTGFLLFVEQLKYNRLEIQILKVPISTDAQNHRVSNWVKIEMCFFKNYGILLFKRK